MDIKHCILERLFEHGNISLAFNLFAQIIFPISVFSAISPILSVFIPILQGLFIDSIFCSLNR